MTSSPGGNSLTMESFPTVAEIDAGIGETVETPAADVSLTHNLSRGQFLSMAVYLTIANVLAFFGNALVIYIILRNKKMRRKSHNLLLLNLAFCDGGIAVFVYPLTTAACYLGSWPFGRGGCVYNGFAGTLLSLTDINTLVAISIYRYIMVCKPRYHWLMNRRSTAGIFIVCCWVHSALWCVSALVGWNNYTFEEFGTSCSINWTGRTAGDVSYTLLMALICYVLHIGIMTFCYVRIHQRSSSVLKSIRSKKAVNADDAVLANRFRSELKVTFLSLTMVITFIAVWSPYAWISFVQIVRPGVVPLWLMTLPTMFAKFACVVNPCVYFALNRTFRDDALALLAAPRRNQVNDAAAAAVRATHKTPHRMEKVAYVINTTKEGIYIGDRRVSLEVQDRAF